jgi:hypothetical protein
VLLFWFLAPLYLADKPIENAMSPFLPTLFGAYFIALIIEWPFVWLALFGIRKRIQLSLRLNFLLQTLSCLVLAFMYYYAATTTIASRIDFSLLEEMPEIGYVYFADEEGLKRIRLGERKIEVIQIQESASGEIQLQVVRENKGAYLSYKGERVTTVALPKHMLADEHFDKDENLIAQPWLIDSPTIYAYIDFNTEKLPASRTNRIVFTIQKLFALYPPWVWRMEAPFGEWSVGRVQFMTDRYYLFQFGAEVCLFDSKNFTLAVLARGTSPVFVPTIEKQEKSN